jgi:hypothetical protein
METTRLRMSISSCVEYMVAFEKQSRINFDSVIAFFFFFLFFRAQMKVDLNTNAMRILGWSDV